jgi:hypothetical protein
MVNIRARRCFMMLLCSIAASSCTTKTPSSATCVPKAPQPSVQWSGCVDGLSLGIQVPERPFVFVPKQGWTGPVIIHEKDDKGRITKMYSNAGGEWERAAVLTVFMRNSSTNAIFWARDSDVWRVSFSAPGFEQPSPWTGPIPPPHRPGPIRLAPQEETKITFPLSVAFDIWPSIPEGQYSVAVSYSPNKLLRFGRGGEGNWTHPYDVIGFWKGKISTPTIMIRVSHPTKRSSRRG